MRATLGLALLFGCLTGLLLADETSYIAKLTLSCLSENGVTAQDIDDLKTGAVTVKDANDNIKCASQCIFVKSGFMDAKGNLLINNIKKNLTGTPKDSAVVKVLSACGETKGDNPCDKAFKIMTCLESKSRAMLN